MKEGRKPIFQIGTPAFIRSKKKNVKYGTYCPYGACPYDSKVPCDP